MFPIPTLSHVVYPHPHNIFYPTPLPHGSYHRGSTARNNEASAKLTTANGGTFTWAQLDSVANHVTIQLHQLATKNKYKQSKQSSWRLSIMMLAVYTHHHHHHHVHLSASWQNASWTYMICILTSGSHLRSKAGNGSSIQAMCNSFLPKCCHEATPRIHVQRRKCLHFYFHRIQRLTDIHGCSTTLRANKLFQQQFMNKE